MAKIKKAGWPGVEGSLDQYLKEIHKIRLLSVEEEVKLAQQIRRGDKRALNILVESNLRFVVKIAREYQNRGLPLEELINLGNLGLIKAAERFDETLGYKFISYAVRWIRQVILQALKQQSQTVRLPLNLINFLEKRKKTTRALQQKLGRQPTVEEVEEVEEELRSERKPRRCPKITTTKVSISLDRRLKSDQQGSLLDIMRDGHPLPDSGLEKESFHQTIEQVLGTLKPREAKVIKLFFGIGQERPLNLQEIGDKLHLSRERVRQIKVKALRKLRHKSRSRLLREYLG